MKRIWSVGKATGRPCRTLHSTPARVTVREEMDHVTSLETINDWMRRRHGNQAPTSQFPTFVQHMTVLTYRETLNFLPEQSVNHSGPGPETIVCQADRLVPTTSV